MYKKICFALKKLLILCLGIRIGKIKKINSHENVVNNKQPKNISLRSFD